MTKAAFRAPLLVTMVILMVVIPQTGTTAEDGGVGRIIDAASAPFNDTSHMGAGIALPENIVRVKEPYQGGVFWTETRKDKMERFRCTLCHNNQKVTAANAAEMAHGDIHLDHGGKEKPLACLTCHNEKARDFLKTERQDRVDLDHSYQLCGQCHFRQKTDWVGGAHGKRVAAWAGKRVVKNCTACHDPHAPLFQKRWPATYSRPFTK